MKLLLITPHGDRKPLLRRLPRLLRVAHYPSWGSETGVWPTPVEVTVNTSLPLMGIGNLDDQANVAHCGCDGRLLITPHGDRKPAVARTDHVHALPSLPLMGIGNRRDFEHEVAGVMVLITPHGDRKRQRHADRSVRRTSHYPSWGSETNGFPHLVLRSTFSLPLMGIGNPSGQRRGAPESPSHYPSWGSETIVRPRGAQRVTTWSHYPSWGSETSGTFSNAHEGRNENLITPHGDRKRRTPVVSDAVTLQYSLPLMGIGNPLFLAVFLPEMVYRIGQNTGTGLQICA